MLVERQGRDGVDAAVQGKLGGRRQKIEGGPTGAGVDDARSDLRKDRRDLAATDRHGMTRGDGSASSGASTN